MRHLATAALAVTLLAGAATAQDAKILRESIGERAKKLAEMELKPFDATLWSRLDSWTNGPGLDRAATDGKVVLIASWSTWSPPARRAIGTLQELKEKYGDRGLIVVGAHHQTGWEQAPQALAERNADFLIAHDAKGEFRNGLQIDQDPDFYLIDRAGQLRFADVRAESVTAAVELLLAEEADSAATLRERLAAEARQREAEARKPRTVQDSVSLRALPEVPFIPPAPALYQIAEWPERSSDDNNRRNDRDQGPTSLPVPQAGWIDGVPPKTDGRAVVYYAWRFNDPRGVDLTQRMDLLQRQVGRDAVIVGVLTGVQGDDNRSRRDEDQIDPAELAGKLRAFRTTHGTTHPMIVDIGGSLLQSDNRSGGREEALLAYVVSSDSTLRWQGPAGSDAMRSALNRIIDIDPGVRARRAAESAYIRSRSGG